MAMLQSDDSLAAPSAGSCRVLAEGERVHMVLGERPQCRDGRGDRWVRVVVGSEERPASRGAAAAPAPTWWALWSDLELVPDGVASAAHDEARMDDLMAKAERGGERLSDEEYQRIWWHRMGVDMGGGLGQVTSQDWKLKGYVNRVRSVLSVREVRGASNKRARTGATRVVSGAPPAQSSSLLPPDFYAGDWSRCPTARAVAPGAVKGRVSVVCPTCEARQHFHELLYRNFCAQSWPDKELVVLDTGGAPSPFFSGQVSQGEPCWTGDGPLSSLSPAEDPRVLYVHMRRYPLTLGHKRNQLIQLASGEVVAHFDDDNLYAPQYLATMVEQLRASRAQLVRLEATFSWSPPSGALLWHGALAFRAETFVHLRGPLRAIAFAHEKCGEEGGLGAVCVIHDLDDTYGVFMHVEHGANISCCSKVGDAWLKGEPAKPSDIPNAQLRSMMLKYERFYISGHR
uniref:Glycosyltransferase 2-like domain-containing protein n=1 Tax=Alexandrium monilatum TaxID=311494 RepID=A0A7S4UU34_9DINO